MHREDDGDHGNKGRYCVSGWYVCANVVLMGRCRPLIANFSFEPAYEGQVINSGTAITMSTYCCDWTSLRLTETLRWTEPADGMPLLVKRVK